MNPSLTPYGFSVNLNICPISVECKTDTGPLIVSTLLGDGGKTQIIQIYPVEDVTGSMLMAVHQDGKGRFYVIPVHSGWNARYGNLLKVSIQDLTGDGQPEIWVDEHTLSGSIFFQKTYIYHWTGILGSGGRFEEVLNGQISGYFENNILSPGGEKNQPGTLQFQNVYFNYSEKVTYRWNGTHFVVSTRKIPFPLDAYLLSIGGLGVAMGDGQFTQIADFLRQPLPVEKLSDPGPGVPDYLAFQRAINSAMQFNQEVASNTLRSLVQSPANPQSPFLDVVKAYRASYILPTDILRACQAAQDVWNRIISKYPAQYGYVDFEQMGAAVGFTLRNEQICNQGAALHQLVKKLDQNLSDRIPIQLAHFGLKIPFSAHFDPNQDGKMDWLLTVSTPESKQPQAAEVWLLLSGTTGPELILLGSSSDSTTGYRLETIQLPGSDRDAFMYTDNSSVQIFRLYAGDGGTAVERLLSEDPVVDHQVIAQPGSTDIILYPDPKQFFPQKRYHWEAALDQFIEFDGQEEELLLQDNPDGVIREVPPLLSKFNSHVQIQYLL